MPMADAGVAKPNVRVAASLITTGALIGILGFPDTASPG
jgi:hypothetical protein